MWEGEDRGLKSVTKRYLRAIRLHVDRMAKL